jgi:hypothetical protein
MESLGAGHSGPCLSYQKSADTVKVSVANHLQGAIVEHCQGLISGGSNGRQQQSKAGKA